MAVLGDTSLLPGHLLSRFLTGLLPIHLLSGPSLFLSWSTHPLAIGFLFHRVLRLVMSTFSDGSSFAWCLLFFPSTVSVETLWHHSQHSQRALRGPLLLFYILLWDLCLILVTYCNRFPCLGASNALKSLSYTPQQFTHKSYVKLPNDDSISTFFELLSL